jgi:hypothetical protein
MIEKVEPQAHILLSDDEAKSWRIAAPGIGKESSIMPWVLVPDPNDSRALFCGLGSCSRGFGYDGSKPGKGAWARSADGGETWQTVLPDLPAVITGWVAPA